MLGDLPRFLGTIRSMSLFGDCPGVLGLILPSGDRLGASLLGGHLGVLGTVLDLQDHPCAWRFVSKVPPPLGTVLESGGPPLDTGATKVPPC